VEEAVDFHRQFSDLPLVTIALKIKEKPNISFDAYQGMKSLVLHCINTHSAKNPVFIRGPLNHTSAEERYQAFCDALIESGIEYNEALVSPPSPWNEGEAAFRKLIEERQLLPGRDFDTIVCASDLLMFTAAKYLQKLGYRIPEDIRIVGFNDSPESKFLSAPGSTVRVPFADMGKSACHMLIDLVSHSGPVPDKVEPAAVVIRNSCGCSHRGEMLDGQGTGLRRGDFTEWGRKRFSLNPEQEQAWLDPLVSALYQGAQEGSLARVSPLLNTIIQRYFDGDPDTLDFQDVMAHAAMLSDLPDDYRQEMIRLCWIAALEAQSRISHSRSYESIRSAKILNSFKCDLLRAWKRAAIPEIMQIHLPALGICRAFLVMFENDTHSRYIGGYTQQGMTDIENELFPAHGLLPEKIFSLCTLGTYLVQPLFIENQVLGYLITSVADRDGLLHEELRSSVSSALKGILLFEETVRAKDIAERAEQVKMEFFATMGEGLTEPLSTILNKMNQFDTMLHKQILFPEPLLEVVASVRNEMSEQLHKTSLLFDYTLSQAGMLEMEQELFHPAPLISSLAEKYGMPLVSPGRVPLILGDKNRFLQVTELLISGALGAEGKNQDLELFLTLTVDGLQFRITKRAGVLQITDHGNELSFIQSIILLHHGNLEVEKQVVSVLFPWPNIGGFPHGRNHSHPEKLFLLTASQDIPSAAAAFASTNLLQLEPLQAEKVLMEKLLITRDEGALLFWDAEGAGLDQYLAMKVLSQHRKLFKIPVICYGEELTGESLMEAVAARINMLKSGPIIFWGPDESAFPFITGSDERFSVASAEQFYNLLSECTPSLIILDSVDMDRIVLIRKQEKTVQLPVIILVDQFPPKAAVDEICAKPLVVLAHAHLTESPKFVLRLREIAGGGEILPPHTGALVKKAVWYLEQHASGQIARWKIAESVNVSEDYLTRIFHKELGMSLWEYLNRFRILMASGLLIRTNNSLAEIALKTGFQ
ncbi:MAG: substrate-binding domain-containing protein, partial [Spirochaetes bacterium]|nr:substrate-binding domain-containing protein [Spirochaetota bacterium]